MNGTTKSTSKLRNKTKTKATSEAKKKRKKKIVERAYNVGSANCLLKADYRLDPDFMFFNVSALSLYLV